MRSVISILFLLLTIISYGQSDSAKMAELGLKLAEYYDAMKHETIDVQKGECDFLIESSGDSLVRQFVAQDIFRHYIASPIMGAENIAVHVFDKWFADKTINMKSDADYMAAKIFAEFNRRSLIGAKAPGLVMESDRGDSVELYGPSSGGRFSVLYFYDTECAKCRVETILLKNLIKSGKYPVDLYAVYTGDNRQSWDSYIKEKMTLDRSKVTHLWDPSLESDFQRKYGVVQTPRLFLIGPDGVVLGRGLDVKNLEILLEGIFGYTELDYGTPESTVLYDGIFASYDGNPSVEQVKGIADYIADRTLLKGDSMMFRQMAGDYLYYLASHSGEGFKEGMKYHIDKNILARGDVWKSAEDSLKVIGFAEIMSDLLSKSLPGTPVPNIKVSGEYYTSKGMKEVKVRLDRLKGDTNIILFYTEGCEICVAQKKAVKELISSGKNNQRIDVLMVNIDKIMSNDPSLASTLMDSFDLSSLPFIIVTDDSGTVRRRYLRF